MAYQQRRVLESVTVPDGLAPQLKHSSNSRFWMARLSVRNEDEEEIALTDVWSHKLAGFVEGSVELSTLLHLLDFGGSDRRGIFVEEFRSSILRKLYDGDPTIKVEGEVAEDDVQGTEELFPSLAHH